MIDTRTQGEAGAHRPQQPCQRCPPRIHGHDRGLHRGRSEAAQRPARAHLDEEIDLPGRPKSLQEAHRLNNLSGKELLQIFLRRQQGPGHGGGHLPAQGQEGL